MSNIIDFNSKPVTYKELIEFQDNCNKFYYSQEAIDNWNNQIEKGLDIIERIYGKKNRLKAELYLMFLNSEEYWNSENTEEENMKNFFKKMSLGSPPS